MNDDFVEEQEEPRLTRNIPFMRGGLDLGSSSVPYFSTSLGVRELNELVELPTQLPTSGEAMLSLDELIQRELDEVRVKQQIEPYLRQPGHPRFFNALTVALLPMVAGGENRLATSYEAI